MSYVSDVSYMSYVSCIRLFFGNHLNSPEITWISFKYNIFVFKNFHKVFVNI